MKNIFTLALSLALFSSSAFATIRTVNNNGGGAQYTSLSAAVTAATTGDTLLVQGSSVNYGSVTLNKALTIIGTGHNPQKQGPLKSFMDYIYFATGSSSSRIIGMTVYMIETNNPVDNIEIKRCQINYRLFIDNAANNWVIEGNYFAFTGECLYGDYYTAYSNMTVRNNVFNGAIREFYMYYGGGYFYVNNNLFLRNGSAFINCRNFYANNNIFYRSSPANGGSISITFSNNLSYQCAANTFPNGTNQTNVDPLFTSFPAAGADFSYSHNYTLQSGSTAKNAGTDGKDIGLTGGNGIWDYNGQPDIPIIRAFNITSGTTIAPNGTLNINFKSAIKP